jgi:hypothetical protein
VNKASEGILKMLISGPSGAMVQLQASNDLIEWTGLTTVSIGSSECYFCDLAATATGPRFYRVIPISAAVVE